MSYVVLAIFVLSYLGLSAGVLPGLALDRTGIAALGAIAMLASGGISMAEAKQAVDVPTLAVLFGMMLLSAQYQASGLYRAIAARMARAANPRHLLAGVIAVTAILSALLTNDVICFALTPLVTASVLQAALPPLPFLLAIACASNIGSALTPIGNPQNILIAQHMDLPFLPFVRGCLLPVVSSLIVLYVFLARQVPSVANKAAAPTHTTVVTLDKKAANKAVLLTLVAIVLFLSSVPAYLTAIGIAGAVMFSRRQKTRDLLGHVDWSLLTLFVALFTLVHAMEVSGWTTQIQFALSAHHIDPREPIFLVPLIAGLSNVISNVPAVMVALPFVGHATDTGCLLALASTFAGNAVLVGSIANLIVVEQAKKLGVSVSFWQHARVGIPLTLVSLGLAMLLI